MIGKGQAEPTRCAAGRPARQRPAGKGSSRRPSQSGRERYCRCCAGTGSPPCCWPPAVVLRVLAQVAYRPALFYIDTARYVSNNPPAWGSAGLRGSAQGDLAGLRLAAGRGGPAPARAGHGRGHLPAPAAPRRRALARRAGYRAGPARRLSAADRDHHAGHGLRGPDRGPAWPIPLWRPAISWRRVAAAAWCWAPRPPSPRSARHCWYPR